jgi:hypothetical protein
VPAEEIVTRLASIDLHPPGHPRKGQTMLARLNAFLARSRTRESQRVGDEYATMAPREREEASWYAVTEQPLLLGQLVELLLARPPGHGRVSGV